MGEALFFIIIGSLSSLSLVHYGWSIWMREKGRWSYLDQGPCRSQFRHSNELSVSWWRFCRKFRRILLEIPSLRLWKKDLWSKENLTCIKLCMQIRHTADWIVYIWIICLSFQSCFSQPRSYPIIRETLRFWYTSSNEKPKHPYRWKLIVRNSEVPKRLNQMSSLLRISIRTMDLFRKSGNNCTCFFFGKLEISELVFEFRFLSSTLDKTNRKVVILTRIFSKCFIFGPSFSMSSL